jgi:hypothetical protein
MSQKRRFPASGIGGRFKAVRGFGRIASTIIAAHARLINDK